MVKPTRIGVVGASVAGLGTALELLKLDRSMEVTCFDRKRDIGDTVCGGAISSFMLRELKTELSSHVVASEITSVRIYSPNGSHWELESEDGVYGYVLWRERFERELAREVAELGGTVRMNHKITDLKELSGYAYVVGADGLTGVTSRLMGFPSKDDVHVAVQTLAYKDHPEGRLDLYFGSEFAHRGYGWVFPAGEAVRVGLGIPLSEKKNPRRLLSKFLDHIGASPTSQVKGKLIPTAKPPRKLVHGNLVLVGDAARLCDPLTGGGIANALLSGKYAAEAISRGKPEKYEALCRGLKRRNRLRYRLKRILYELSDEDFNEMIEAMEKFKPKLTRISWAMAHALLRLASKKPELYVRHKVLRRLMD